MSDIENEDAQPPPVAQPAAQPAKFFKLPDFWQASPAAWFGVAESQFALRGVTAEADRFGLVTAALPEAVARRVAHLLAAPPADSFTALKAALLSTHQLTEIQKADKLFSMEPLGAKRPMDLLSEMMELVPPGEEKTKLFAMLFLRRLPAAVRVQLTEDDFTDLRALAEKADRCAASLAKQAHESSVHAAVAALSLEEDGGEEAAEFPVAAFGASRGRPNSRGGGNGGRRNGGNSFRGKGKKHHGKQSRQQGDGGSGGESKPFEVALAASGLCRSHFLYGASCWDCKQPCGWQGN